MFRSICRPRKGQSLIDLGCGAGAGGKALAEQCGLNVTYLDLTPVGNLEPFIQGSLWNPIPHKMSKPCWPAKYRFGYCCDVMEHLPEPFTMLAARNMLEACHGVFFSIAFYQDSHGDLIGQRLHLTVKPFTWWLKNLSELGTVKCARDRLGEGVFYVES